MTPSPTILLVDDEDSTRKIVTAQLESQGLRVLPLSSGDAVVPAVKESHPDLVILDLNMPDKDGWTVAKELKEDDSTKELPIIAMSGLSQSEDRQSALDAGCHAYAQKPLSTDELMASIRQLLPDL
ncbi:MAG: response regulator [Verrucomicrobiota bacterium]